MTRQLFPLLAFSLLALPLLADEGATSKTDPSGTWHWVQDYGQGPVQNWLMLKIDDEQLAGTYRRNETDFSLQDCSIDDDSFSFKLDLQHNNKPVNVTCTAKVDGDNLTGTSSVVFKGQTTQIDLNAKRATRPADVVGNWLLHIEARDQVFEPELQVVLEDETLRAKYVTKEVGTHEIEKITLKDNTLHFDLRLEGDAGQLDLKYEAIPRGNAITGTVHYEAGSTSGSADFTGKRTKSTDAN